MRRTIILGSVLTVLAIGNAAGSETSWMFVPSEQSDFPAARVGITAPAVQTEVSPRLGGARRTFGYSSSEITGSTDAFAGDENIGFSAAQGFGPSDENDLPLPRFQKVR